MNESQLTIKCYPTQEIYKSGGAVPLRVELKNEGNEDIEILAAGVPWIFHHALKFTISKGIREGVAFENRLWVIEPPSVPDITIERKKSAYGVVDLARYLFTQDGRSIGEVPGTYTITARLLTFISIKGQDEQPQKLEIGSEPFVVVIEN